MNPGLIKLAIIGGYIALRLVIYLCKKVFA